MNSADDTNYDLTLDPPGRIAVVGAGPLGIEAALYGRFLGYEVFVFEQADIGQSLKHLADAPLPMLPDRCLSPLAVPALQAQDRGLIMPSDPTYPLTVRQWVENGLLRLAATDLLHDRVATNCEVTAMETVVVETNDQDDDDSYIDGDVPEDFRLTIRDESGLRTEDFEAVILAMGVTEADTISGYQRLIDAAYLFRIGQANDGSEEERLHRGWRQIVAIYAGLGGRAGLDLYRPLRS